MKSFLIGLVIVILLAVIGYGGWFYFIKKSPEGGKCTNDSRCEIGKCVSGACSSGKLSSACKTYNDCEQGLLCLKNKCSQKPDYSKYFAKINVSKIKPGEGPGPSNMPIATTEFNQATDAIEVDLIGVKSTTNGKFYFELINSTSGETALSTENRQGATAVNGQDIGTGTDLSGIVPGSYDLNFYLNKELLYTTTITIK